MSLLSSRTDSQRKESLSYLTNAVASRPSNQPLPQPLGVLLPKLLPLILDANNGVRSQLLKLLQALPNDGIDTHAEQINLYIRAGMTHLAQDIRISSLELFDWAIATCGKELVECPGGWTKNLKTFQVALGWSTTSNNVTSASSGWSRSKNTSSLVGNKMATRFLTTLATFLELGLAEEPDRHDEVLALRRHCYPLHQTWIHQIPKRSHAYRHLNLFGPPRNEEDEMYGDLEARQEAFKKYQDAFENGLENAKKEGGEIGRAASKTAKVVSGGMKDAI